VRAVIEAHYSEEDFGLPQLCQKIGMSRSQLFRKMKALTDIAPSDLIRTRTA
jgi:predicted DNA-binding transcriptional regulator AlpA